MGPVDYDLKLYSFHQHGAWKEVGVQIYQATVF